MIMQRRRMGHRGAARAIGQPGLDRPPDWQRESLVRYFGAAGIRQRSYEEPRAGDTIRTPILSYVDTSSGYIEPHIPSVGRDGANQ